MEALILILCIPVVLIGAPVLYMVWCRRHIWMKGPDGYPQGRSVHKDRCPCDRCLDQLHRDIHRLEVELGMTEPEPPRNIVGARLSNGEKVMTLRADRITAEYLRPGEQKTLQPVPWFVSDR